MTLFFLIITFINIYVIYKLLNILKYFNRLDYYKYKVNNLKIVWFFALLYLFIFVFLLYYLRFFSLGKETNLKILYYIILILKEIFLLLPLLYKLITIILIILLIITIILLVYIINYILSTNLHCLYLYYFKYIENKFLFAKSKLHNISNIDIISYFIIELVCKITNYYYGENFSYDKLPKYHPYRLILKIGYSKKYPIFISLLPLFIIFFECLLCDFTLFYFYYFIIVYFPIILIRKVTTYLSKNAAYIMLIVWDIYYNNNDKNIIYAVSPEIKPLWDLYFINNLQVYNVYDFDFQWNLFLTIKFILNDTIRKSYVNELSTLILIFDNESNTYKLFEDIEEEDENYNVIYKLGKEWNLIAIK